MKSKRVYTLIALLLVLTAPWPFLATRSSAVILGFPPWAFYCLCMTVVFAIATALVLRFSWQAIAEQDEQRDE